MTFSHQKKMHMFLCESEPKVESWRVWSRQLEIIRLNLCDSFEKDQTFNCRKYNSSQGPRKVWKSGCASIIWQVKSPPPPGWDRVNWSAQIRGLPWHPDTPKGRHPCISFYHFMNLALLRNDTSYRPRLSTIYLMYAWLLDRITTAWQAKKCCTLTHLT